MIFSGFFADCLHCLSPAVVTFLVTARIASHLHESNDSGSFRARGMLAEALAEAVASAVLRRYASLPKNGKPQPGEYTLLAGFAVTDDAVPDAPPRVVALGTGTKCLPASSRCPRGEALSDSHAEVIARRAFVRFLYDEFERAMEVDEGDAVEDAAARDETKTNEKSQRSIVEYLRGASSTTPFRLRGGVRVHLYASQSPCGDASIFTLASGSRPDPVPSPRARCPSPSPPPRGGTKELLARVANTPPDVRETTKKSKRAKTSGGGSGASFAGATGAKRIVVVDKEHGVDFGSPFGKLAVDNEHGVLGQTLGACRLKPGRGARTDCMSCSDKIARWVALGAQGALPSSLMRPTRVTGNASVFHDPANDFGRDRLGSGGTNQALSSFETIRSYGAVRLASVVVSAPDDASAATGTEKENVLAALRRALVDRVPGDVPGDAHPKPGVFVVPPAPPELSSSAGQRRGWVASGTSVNWYWRRDEKETRERGESARRDANDAEEKKKKRRGFFFFGNGGDPRRYRSPRRFFQEGSVVEEGAVSALPRVARGAVRGGGGEGPSETRGEEQNAFRGSRRRFQNFEDSSRVRRALRRRKGRKARRDDAFVARDDVRDVEASVFRGVRRARARVPRGAVAVREVDRETPRAGEDVQGVHRRVVTRRETRRRLSRYA